MELKKTCNGTCKKYKVKKPTSGGRYEAGQGRCQVCDIWISYRGAHTKDGSPAKMGSVGWFCNCCNFRIRQKPRSRVYKEKLSAKNHLQVIPKYQEITLPILQICSDRKRHPMRELVDEVADMLELTHEARRYIMRKNETVLYNRASWALTYLRKAGLVESYRGEVSITGHGQDVLQQKPDKIDKRFLMNIPKFAEFYNKSNKGGGKKQTPTEQNDQLMPHTSNADTDRLNWLIAEALRLIKSSPNGTHMQDLRVLLDISQEEMSDLALRLKRIEGVTMMKIRSNKRQSDFLFTYEEPKIETEPESRKQHIGVEDGPKAKTKDILDRLVRRMLEDYSVVKKSTDKHLQKDLTVEFLHTGSIKSVMKSHPGIPKEVIKRHIRTPLRLPEKLRIRNEGGLHTDPQISLQIALFAVNLHDWDGEGDGEGNVLQTAEWIARHLTVVDPEGKAGMPGRMSQKNTAPPADPIPTSTAVWIAVATLHREHGMGMLFSTRHIVEKIKEQNLCDVSHTTIVTHVASHCVANSPTTNKNMHRKTYRVGPGTYRLYKRGDPYHHTRKSCHMAPLPFQLPTEYRDLRRWYDEEYCAQP